MGAVNVRKRLSIIKVVDGPKKMEIRDCLVGVVDGGTIVDGGFSWFGQCVEDIVLDFLNEEVKFVYCQVNWIRLVPYDFEVFCFSRDPVVGVDPYSSGALAEGEGI
ncbi:hypothetical protein CEXT_209621 [Caerostris extrusa]|uniref:Uncharacterized protein n=1 Tax=Caerostris extrusa TaxID=172846 RepID=A0AAV4PIF5_CAEEX|nr:hypothetical protein CEXT_209621 [Caerostris extrusa]